MSNCPHSPPTKPRDGAAGRPNTTEGLPETRGETRDPPKRAAIDGIPDTTTSARRSTFHQHQHDQTTCTQCLSKERCRFASVQYSLESQHKISADPIYGQMPSSPRGEHAAAATECDFEAYEPMKRWKDEEFREQPWHGIARELMPEAFFKARGFSGHKGKMILDEDNLALNNEHCNTVGGHGSKKGLGDTPGLLR